MRQPDVYSWALSFQRCTVRNYERFLFSKPICDSVPVTMQP